MIASQRALAARLAGIGIIACGFALASASVWAAAAGHGDNGGNGHAAGNGGRGGTTLDRRCDGQDCGPARPRPVRHGLTHCGGFAPRHDGWDGRPAWRRRWPAAGYDDPWTY